MKKLSALFVALFIVFVGVYPASAEGIYIAPKISFSVMDMDGKGNSPIGGVDYGSFGGNVFGVALAVGYDFKPKFDVGIRIELEEAINGSFSDDSTGPIFGLDSTIEGELSSSTLFINTYYDFHNSSKFVPYVGLGFGLAFVGFEASGNTPTGSFNLGKTTQTNFAWNVGIGVSYSFTDNTAMDLGYRFVSLGDGESNRLQDVYASAEDVTAHQFMLGFRYTF